MRCVPSCSYTISMGAKMWVKLQNAEINFVGFNALVGGLAEGEKLSSKPLWRSFNGLRTTHVAVGVD
jgi:hypothetical protein